MEKIIAAAQLKFGMVLLCVMTTAPEDNNSGEYKLLIKRHTPTFKDRPMMTITASQPAGCEPSFYWGHYDIEDGIRCADEAKALVGKMTAYA